jgi:hypothetical protein
MAVGTHHNIVGAKPFGRVEQAILGRVITCGPTTVKPCFSIRRRVIAARAR